MAYSMWDTWAKIDALLFMEEEITWYDAQLFSLLLRGKRWC